MKYYVHLDRAMQSGIAVDALEALESDDVKPAPKADNEVKQPRGNANGNALGNDLAKPGNAQEFDPRMLN